MRGNGRVLCICKVSDVGIIRVFRGRRGARSRDRSKGRFDDVVALNCRPLDDHLRGTVIKIESLKGNHIEGIKTARSNRFERAMSFMNVRAALRSL